MFTLRARLQPAKFVMLPLMVIVTCSCALPFLPSSTAEPEVTGPVEATPAASTPILSNTSQAQDIPGEILTEVAATISARITQEAREAPPSKTTGEPISAAPTANAPQAPAPIVTVTPTLTDSRTEGMNLTATPSPTLTQPSPSISIRPPIGGYSDSGFQIRGLNIHWCSGQPWAIFRVRNRSSNPLESLSLLYQDISDDKSLAGPYVSNAPFMANDKSCVSGGIENLSPGNTRYLGNSLGSRTLQGHNIRATIILCTGNDLSGTCYQNIADFIMP